MSVSSNQIAQILKYSRVRTEVQEHSMTNFSLVSAQEQLEAIQQTTAMAPVNKNHWRPILQIKDRFFSRLEINLKFSTPKLLEKVSS